MTELLRQVIAQIEKLPANQQDAVCEAVPIGNAAKLFDHHQ